MTFKISSTAFGEGHMIPLEYSRGGGNISPPLEWNGIPDGTKSLALVVDDPDAPSGLFVHWILFGIAPTLRRLERGQSTASIPGVRSGRNGFGNQGYDGPQPPEGTHRYYFHLYALDHDVNLKPGASRSELDHAMEGHVLGHATMMGKFQRRMSGSSAA